MGKKILLPISLIVFVMLAIFVSALDGKMTGGNDSPYDVAVDVSKGWNIIAGIVPNAAISEDSEIKAVDLKVVWYYAPNLKQYVQVHPKLDMNAQVQDDVALTSAMWVYSNKAGRLKYSTLEDYMPVSFRELSAGYNFVTMTPDMYSGELDGSGYDDEHFIWDNIKGTCNFERITAWNSQTQEWMHVDSDFDFGEEFGDFVGMGMVVKVSDDCKFGEPSEEGNQPPVLPSSE